MRNNIQIRGKVRNIAASLTGQKQFSARIAVLFENRDASASSLRCSDSRNQSRRAGAHYDNMRRLRQSNDFRHTLFSYFAFSKLDMRTSFAFLEKRSVQFGRIIRCIRYPSQLPPEGANLSVSCRVACLLPGNKTLHLDP